MAAQTTFINNLLNAAFRGQTYTGGVIKMGLFTAGLPSGTGVEVTGGGYVRPTLTYAVASVKSIATSADATFTDLPTNKDIVAYGIYSGTTLIDEAMLTTVFRPDLTNNELKVSHRFKLEA